MAGETVTVRFTLRNAGKQTLKLWNVVASGRGPDCSDWTCQLWGDPPGERNLELGPGQEYRYEARRAYAQPGSYFIQPLYMFTSEDWHLLGARTDFRVTRGIEVVNPLALQPSQPVIGMPVRATYTVRNAGGRSLTLAQLGVVARGPNCAGSSWECPAYADWPSMRDLTLALGAQYTYDASRSYSRSARGIGQNLRWRMIIHGGLR